MHSFENNLHFHFKYLAIKLCICIYSNFCGILRSCFGTHCCETFWCNFKQRPFKLYIVLGLTSLNLALFRRHTNGSNLHAANLNQEQVLFLHKCLWQQALPTSVRFRFPINYAAGWKIAQQNGWKMVHLMIMDACLGLHKCQHVFDGFKKKSEQIMMQTNKDNNDHQHHLRKRNWKGKISCANQATKPDRKRWNQTWMEGKYLQLSTIHHETQYVPERT